MNNLPHPLPPQAMLSFDDQMHIYTRKTFYLHLSTLYWGGGGDYAQIVPLKITIVVPNDSLVIFWMVFISVPTTFDLHCIFYNSVILKQTFDLDFVPFDVMICVELL